MIHIVARLNNSPFMQKLFSLLQIFLLFLIYFSFYIALDFDVLFPPCLGFIIVLGSTKTALKIKYEI